MYDMTIEWSDTQATKQCGVTSPVLRAWRIAASDFTALQDASGSTFFTQTVKMFLYIVCAVTKP